ncbi:hypothetical protein AB4Y44_36180 [Paraburkholderia sp. BR10937]|uniref:hypothetical protein n=1 Tax=Paraburkholderia sp. BR10937 TaxID=3236994 RepID=UPI0034D1537C
MVCADHPLNGKPDETIATRIELDIEGNQRQVRDERKLPDVDGLDGQSLDDQHQGVYHLVSARYDFTDDWPRHETVQDQPIKLVITRAHLPYVFQSFAKPKAGVVLWAKPNVYLTEDDIIRAPQVTIAPVAGDSDSWEITIPPADAPSEDAYVLLNYGVSAG